MIQIQLVSYARSKHIPSSSFFGHLFLRRAGSPRFLSFCLSRARGGGRLAAGEKTPRGDGRVENAERGWSEIKGAEGCRRGGVCRTEKRVDTRRRAKV